jgi:hypothetical protein
MSASLLSTLESLTVTGNASAINGLTPGATTPNLSTRTAFQQAVALLNSPSSVGADAESSSMDASATLASLASTVTGTGTGSSFNGSSAISGANILGISNSDISVGQNVLTNLSAPLSASNRGTISGTATGSGSSTSSTVTGTSSAAVVDLAAIGLFNSDVTIGGSGNLSFSGSLSGNASASGVTVGTPTPVNTNPTGPLNGSGVNSILNLDARGLSPQTQYFEDPISPFFAEFSGLQAAPTVLTTVPAGSGDITIGADGNIDAMASALGSSTATNVTGDTNAFAGVFSGGALLIDNIVIGQDGNVSGSSNVGLDTSGASPAVAPIETSSSTTTGSASAITNILSAGLGTSAVRSSAGTIGGSTPTAGNPIPPASISIGRDGNVSGDATAFALTSSNSTTGDVVAFTGGLTGSGGNTFASTFNPGNALTVGIFNLDINAVGHNNVSGTANAGFISSAQTTTGDATAASTTITAGIFGADLSAGGLPQNTSLDIVNGNVTGIAQAVNAVRANTITGNASAVANNTVVGIGNTNITIAGSGSITASADLTSLAGTLTP